MLTLYVAIPSPFLGACERVPREPRCGELRIEIPLKLHPKTIPEPKVGRICFLTIKRSFWGPRP